MTGPPADAFDALRLPKQPIAPRRVFADELRVRVHRRMGLPAPPEFTPMAKALGLEYEVGGRDDGEAVLFIHAGTATAYLPLMQERALADRYRLVRYHRRGYAGSDGFSGAASLEQHVQDAVALLDRLGIERAHVVGHSGSGLIALQLTLDAPEVVRTLVLEEPALMAIDPRWAAAMREVTAVPVERARAGDPRRAMEMWMQAISATWRADLARTVPGGPQQTLDDAAAFFVDVELVEAWEFDRARVAEITQPVLFVLCADAAANRAILRRFGEVVPHTEQAVLSGVSHMLHTDRPDLVAADLGAFFARHAADT